MSKVKKGDAVWWCAVSAGIAGILCFFAGLGLGMEGASALRDDARKAKNAMEVYRGHAAKDGWTIVNNSDRVKIEQ